MASKKGASRAAINWMRTAEDYICHKIDQHHANSPKKVGKGTGRRIYCGIGKRGLPESVISTIN